MPQNNDNGENYQIQTGQGNQNFFGGTHSHYHGVSSSLENKVGLEKEIELIRKNIFLELFNPDSRLVLGVYDDLNNKNQYKLLQTALNTAVFLCDDFVMLPPTFLLECPIVLKLIKSNNVFLSEGIIRMPMRDKSFTEFYEKKLEEYSEVTGDYPKMFGKMGEQAVDLMKKFAHTKIERNAKIGQGLANMWLEGADVNPYWKKHTQLISSNTLEKVRYIPEALHNRGRAVTHGLITKQCPYDKTGMPVLLVQKLLQHSYSAIYINEYNLKVISNLPFSQDVFGHGINNLPYDFEALKASLKPLGLFDIILNLLPEEMVSLRYSSGYTKFIYTFDKISHKCNSASQIRKYFSLASKNSSGNFKKILENEFEGVSDEKVEIISEILVEASLSDM